MLYLWFSLMSECYCMCYFDTKGHFSNAFSIDIIIISHGILASGMFRNVLKLNQQMI